MISVVLGLSSTSVFFELSTADAPERMNQRHILQQFFSNIHEVNKDMSKMCLYEEKLGVIKKKQKTLFLTIMKYQELDFILPLYTTKNLNSDCLWGM